MNTHPGGNPIFVIFIHLKCLVHVKDPLHKKLIKDANFLPVYNIECNMYVNVICLHARDGRCAKTEQSSYGLYQTKKKQCGSCILMTKLVTKSFFGNVASDAADVRKNSSSKN